MTTETVTEEVVETTTTTAPQAPASKTLDELQAENARMAKALKDANRESADRRKKLDDFEKAEQARKDAELSEFDKLKKEADTLRAQAASATRQVLQRDIAAEVGLPPVFAGRIQGADRDAMLADAQVMLAALPKPGAPALTPTNPGGGTTRGETDEEKRKRLGLR